LQHDDTGCRFWAAWSAVLLGERNAVESLKTFATLDSCYREQSLQLVLRVMDSREAQPWLKGLAAYPEALRYVIIGTGVVGDPLIMPWLFEQMENSDLARVAGETFSMITGVDIAYEDLEGEWPEGFEAGPTDNPEDDDVAMDADEDLPWPNHQLIQVWWQKNQQRFQPGTRYLCGQPITVENCQRVLRKGYQRQRRAAALELALLQREAPVFNTSAPGFRQQKLLNQI